MPEIMPFLYHRIEMLNGQIQILEDRISIYQKLLQEVKCYPSRSEGLLQKAIMIDSLGLNALILVKVSPKSSPDYNMWSLYGLSHKTGKKYFPEKHGTRDYQRENNYMVFHFHDQSIVDKLTEKMTCINESFWEYIGHVRDLVND